MRVVFTLSASDSDLAPSSPMLLSSRSSVVRVVFTLSASDSDLAPSSPMLLSAEIKCCESGVHFECI